MAKKDNVLQMKIISVLSVAVAFVILYLALRSGNDTATWAGLAVMAVSNIILYMNF